MDKTDRKSLKKAIAILQIQKLSMPSFPRKAVVLKSFKKQLKKLRKRRKRKKLKKLKKQEKQNKAGNAKIESKAEVKVLNFKGKLELKVASEERTVSDGKQEFSFVGKLHVGQLTDQDQE